MFDHTTPVILIPQSRVSMGSEGTLKYLSDKDYNELFDLMSAPSQSSSNEKRIKNIFNEARRSETRHKVRAQGRGNIVDPIKTKNVMSALSTRSKHSIYRNIVRGAHSKKARHEAALINLNKQFVRKAKPVTKMMVKPASKTRKSGAFKANTKRGYVTPAPVNKLRGLTSANISKKWWISHFGKA